jgi:hypothetical protein
MSGRLVVASIGVLALAGLVGLWLFFHALPRETDLHAMLQAAQFVEIFQFSNGVPTRWVRFDDPRAWNDLSERIRYRGTFWGFSDEPRDAIVIQTIKDGTRYGAFEARGDGCLHIRKGARWYRMPVEPGFEVEARRLLEARGQDLPPGQMRDSVPKSSIRSSTLDSRTRHCRENQA